MKISRFLQQRQTRDRRIPLWLPGFSFAQISPLLWSFSRFWSIVIEIKVLNEEEYSILSFLYYYSLQKQIFLAFRIDLNSHHCIFAYILLRNQALLFPEWRPICPTLRQSSIVNMEKNNFTNFENSQEINKNSYTIIFQQ